MCLALKTNPIKSLAESHPKVKFDQIHQPQHQPYASISSEYMHIFWCGETYNAKSNNQQYNETIFCLRK